MALSSAEALLDSELRTVQIKPGTFATYIGGQQWKISRRVSHRRPRGRGDIMTTRVVLDHLPGNSLERQTAETILTAFGDPPDSVGQ
jgi:hypothetical protein